MTDTDNTKTAHEANRRDATDYVRHLKHFYMTLMSYIITNIILVIINLISSPHHLWFYWVSIFWGLTLCYQAMNVFGPARKFNKEWEEKKIQAYLNKKDK